MTKILGTLTPTPTSPRFITFKQGKRAIRSILREAGIKGVKTFRPRSKNRNEFCIEVNGGIVRAMREPFASVIFFANA